MNDGSLTSRIAKGASWIFAARFVMRLFGLLNTIVVARLLVPEDFGLVAVGVTTMQLLQGFSDIGVSQAMVRFRDATRKDVDTLFTLSFIRGTAMALLLLLAAPFAAVFFGDSRFFWVFAGLSLFPFLTGMINPRFYEFERELDFSKEFILLIANKLAGVVVSIAIAVIFRTYWAIILGLATNAAVQLGLSYWMRPYRPRLTMSSFRKVIGFSGWLTGVSFVAALNNKLDALILARTLGANDTGNYYIGQQLADLPTTELAYPISRAIFPGLSSLQGDPERMRKAFLRGVEVLAAIAMPAGLGFAFIAADLINLLLGQKWQAAIPVIQILAPVFALQTLFLATQFYAMALGLTKLVFIRETAFFFIRTPAFIWGAVNHGLLGALWAVALCGLIHAGFNLALYGRASGDKFWRPLWKARRSFVAALSLIAFFWLVRPVFSGAMDGSAVLRIAADIVCAALVYVSVHLAVWRLEGTPDGAERSIIDLGTALLGERRRGRKTAR